uniref:Crossover junction endonuclease MUS81 n=1 Tax=Meloidogyne floridensis TaxID=298350 RepID=A0A915PAM8_9BILA
MIKEEVEGRATNNNKIQAPRIEETTFPIAASNTLDQNLVFEFSLPPLHFFIHYKPTESAVNEGLNTYKTSTGKSLFLRQQQQTKLLERFGIYRSSGVGICSGDSDDAESISEEHQQQQQLHYSPSENVESSIILISDNREEISKGNRAKGKSIGEFLISGGIKWESHWQTGRLNEIVLDYIVERKTWDDFKLLELFAVFGLMKDGLGSGGDLDRIPNQRSSLIRVVGSPFSKPAPLPILVSVLGYIREPRYLEQKCRLQKCEINNIVLIVEGSTNVCDRSLEQAIISNRVDNDFLVHPTLNKQGKAKFLQFLTKRLEEKCCKEEVIA